MACITLSILSCYNEWKKDKENIVGKEFNANRFKYRDRGKENCEVFSEMCGENNSGKYLF